MIISFHTLGCRLNQAEEDSLKSRFWEAGFLSGKPEKADICVINTCSVTDLAQKKSLKKIREIKRKNPQIKIVAMGCGVEGGKKTPEIELLITNKDKARAFQIIKEHLKITATTAGSNMGSPAARTRAILKIQDGCNNYCAYCIVPHLRGKESSIDPLEILGQARKMDNQGYKELVLSGVNVGKYNANLQGEGFDLQSEEMVDLLKLIKTILKETTFPRIRLSSINPQDITEELVNLWAKEPRLCRHFHLSLQSGSDAVLKRMGRPYNTNYYKDLVKKIVQKMPDVAITTDVIVGFPGETESEFIETLKFIQEIGFANVHIFRYSKREGTRAATMENQVPGLLKKERALKLQEISNIMHTNFVQKFVGREMDVLFEKARGEYRYGLTSNYLRVRIPSGEVKRGEIKRVTLKLFLPEDDTFITA